MFANPIQRSHYGYKPAATISDTTKDEFCQLIDDGMKSMYHLVLRLARNSTDAKDLVNESIVGAWATCQKLDGKNKFRPWILKILPNGFISQYRKKSGLRLRSHMWRKEKAPTINSI